MSEWGATLTGVGTYGEWANVTVYLKLPSENKAVFVHAFFGCLCEL